MVSVNIVKPQAAEAVCVDHDQPTELIAVYAGEASPNGTAEQMTR